MHFTDYFRPCSPGTEGSQLVNGQFYEPRFGSDTLQTMLTDDAFSDPGEIGRLEREISRLKSQTCSNCDDLEDELTEKENEIENLKAEIRELELRVPKP